MPINSWRNKMWCIPIVEYHYSAIKRSGILTQATAWMSLENMLSEVKQTQKVKYRESAYVKLLELAKSQNQKADEAGRTGERGKKSLLLSRFPLV